MSRLRAHLSVHACDTVLDAPRLLQTDAGAPFISVTIPGAFYRAQILDQSRVVSTTSLHADTSLYLTPAQARSLAEQLLEQTAAVDALHAA